MAFGNGFLFQTKFTRIGFLLAGLQPTEYESSCIKNLQKTCALQIVLLRQAKTIRFDAKKVLKKILLFQSRMNRPSAFDVLNRFSILTIPEQIGLRRAISGLNLQTIIVLDPACEDNVTTDLLPYASEGVYRIYFGQRGSINELFLGKKLINLRLEKLFYRNSKVVVEILRRGTLRIFDGELALNYDGILEATLSWWPSVLNISGKAIYSTKKLKIDNKQKFRLGFWLRAGAYALGSSLLVSLKRIKHVFYLQKWNVATIDQSLGDLVRSRKLVNRKWLPSGSKFEFIADPFPIFHNGKMKLFVEKYSLRYRKGVVVEVDPFSEKMHGKKHSAIELPTHVSYPSLIVDDQKLYCLPETLGEKEIALYQCIEYPNRWVKFKVLKAGLWSDPTVFKHERRWWLFATNWNPYSGGNDQLYAWWADSLCGVWITHALNPIKTDVCSSRSAGIPFFVDGNLYRPAQDCSNVYGGALTIQKVIELTPLKFTESEVHRLTPDEQYPEGCHHLAGFGDLTIIDGRKLQFSIFAPFVRLWNRMTPINKSTNQNQLPHETSTFINTEHESIDVQTSW